MKETSILFPTCFRLDLLKETFPLWTSTTAHLPVEFVLVVEEDRDTMNYLRENAPENSIFVWNDTRMGNLKAWNEALRHATKNMIFMAGDDGFPEPKWLDYALEAHHEQLQDYGMVALNDGNFGRNPVSGIFDGIVTTNIFDRRFCKDFLGGVATIPHYKRWATDNEFHGRALASGRLYWEERAVVRHRPEVVDRDHLTRAEGWQHQAADGLLVSARAAAGYIDDFPPII